MAAFAHPVPSPRLLRRGLCVLALCAGLAACAGTGAGIGARHADGADLATASDQTEADRRAKLHLELASGYFSRGQFTVALDEVKKVLADKPDMPEAYSLRGLIYGALDDPGTAEESFRHALRLRPGDIDTLHNYAWFLCQLRRWRDADAQFAQALALPGYHDTARTLLAQGVCQARSGRTQDAERTLSRSYELDPASPTTAVNLSEVLYRRGEYERARFYIRRVNAKPEFVSAQTLWLAARIEHRLGQQEALQELGSQLHAGYPQSPEALLFDKGRFDE